MHRFTIVSPSDSRKSTLRKLCAFSCYKGLERRCNFYIIFTTLKQKHNSCQSIIKPSQSETLSLGFKDSPSSRSRWTQVTRMMRPPGLHTRCISDMNLTRLTRHNLKSLQTTSLWQKTWNVHCTHTHTRAQCANVDKHKQFIAIWYIILVCTWIVRISNPDLL